MSSVKNEQIEQACFKDEWRNVLKKIFGELENQGSSKLLIPNDNYLKHLQHKLKKKISKSDKEAFSLLYTNHKIN